MLLFMDVHRNLSASPDDVAQAHELDVQVQDKYNVRYTRYRFNEDASPVYCLVEAPNMTAAMRVHREAHGLMPDELIEVTPEEVDRFLGAKGESDPATDPDDGAFRAIMFTGLEDSTRMDQELGDQEFHKLLLKHDRLIRDQVEKHSGSEIKHTGDGFLIAFHLASNSVQCAIAIQKAVAARNAAGSAQHLRVRVGVSAGEPVNDHDDIFGAAVQLAARVCASANAGQILASRVIGDLCIGKPFDFRDIGETSLKGFSQPANLLEVAWVE